MGLPEKIHPWIDVKDFPLLRQRYPANFSDSDLEAFIVSLQQVIPAIEQPFAWVVDVDAMVKSTAHQRKIMAESEKRMAEHDRMFCVGSALYVANPIIRGIVTAVFWLSPPVYPYTLVGDLKAGENWALRKLQLAGVDIADK